MLFGFTKCHLVISPKWISHISPNRRISMEDIYINIDLVEFENLINTI
jgi:hypothetical protein